MRVSLVLAVIVLVACGDDGSAPEGDAFVSADAAVRDLGASDLARPDARAPDDAGGPSDAFVPSCDEGASRCGESGREVCSGGAFAADPCGDGERCVSEAGVASCRCDFGRARCSGDIRQVCNAGGVFEDASCSEGRVCRVVAEVPTCVVCAPGERRCQDDAREICDDAGNWVPEACPAATVCRSIDSSIECTEPCSVGDTRCAGEALAETCAAGGYWEGSACAPTEGCWDDGSTAACVEGCDPSAPPLWYPDGDGDGYGTGMGIPSCVPLADHALSGGDCRDDRAAVNPGARERCDAAHLDEDCDGMEGLEPGADCRGLDWNSVSFAGLDLTGIDLRNASPQTSENDFTGATLDGANLVGLTFLASDMDGVSFVGANLREAELTSVSLDGADLSDANLRRTSWQGISASGVTFDRADAFNATFSGVTFTDGSGDGLSLRSATLGGTFFRGGVYANVDASRASFSGSGFQMATLSDSSFEFARSGGGFYLSGSTLTRCSLDGSAGYGLQFEDSTLTDVTYREVDYDYLIYDRTMGTGLLWDGAHVVDARLEGATLDGAGTGARLQITRGAGATLAGSLRGLTIESGSDLDGVTFDADLRDADFTAVSLGSVGFASSDLTGAALSGGLGSVAWGTATCPDGSAAAGACSGAQLTPATCVGDALEPNDVPSGAPPVSGALIACGDADFFDLGTISGSRLTVSLTFMAASGALRVHVLSLDGEYVQGETLSASGDLVVMAPPTGTYHLFVANVPGATPMSYGVSVAVTP